MAPSPATDCSKYQAALIGFLLTVTLVAWTNGRALVILCEKIATTGMATPYVALSPLYSLMWTVLAAGAADVAVAAGVDGPSDPRPTVDAEWPPTTFGPVDEPPDPA